MARPPLSLKARALAALARREHSRLELRRKLAPHAESAEQLDALLDELQAQRWLSEERFAEQLVNGRGARFGLQRIRHELAQHRLDAQTVAPLLDALKQTERQRALDVWARKFGSLPQDAVERGRQQRFLLQRGFSSDAVIWVLKGAPDA